MQQIAEMLIYEYYGTMPEKVTALGGGFYGRVFLAKHSKEFGRLVVKIYLFPNLAQKEANQLRILSSYSSVKMPKVYFVHTSSKGISMERIMDCLTYTQPNPL